MIVRLTCSMTSIGSACSESEQCKLSPIFGEVPMSCAGSTIGAVCRYDR